MFDSVDSTGPSHSLHGTEPPAEPIVTAESEAFVFYASDGEDRLILLRFGLLLFEAIAM